MPPESEHWRYPGPASFRDDDVDRQVFFGRDDEAREVLNRLLAHSLMVLYGKSGLGKTSLLQAGLYPLLRERHRLPIRLRFNQRGADWLDELKRSAVATCRQHGIAYTPGEGASLWEFLNTALFSAGDQFLEPVLILDQFEEIFTLQDSDYRQSLATQLGYVMSAQPPPELRERLRATDKDSHLAEPPRVRLLLSLREEYVGTLQELAPALPGVLGQRFRLGPLQREQASDAIERPASLPDSLKRFASRPFNYQSAAVKAMLEFLTGKHGEIEPFQLQVLCSHVERQAVRRQAQQEAVVSVDEPGYLGGKAGMQRVLKRFYGEALSTLPGGLWQRQKARQLCEQGLLSPEGYRESLGEGQIRRRYGLKPAGLNHLVESKVLRREDRLDNFSYEISHDSLAGTIHQTRQASVRRFRWVSLLTVILLAGFGVFMWHGRDSEMVAAQTNLNAYKGSVQDLLNHGLIKRPVMVEIPAGTFTMGSQKWGPDEQPARTVTIPSFRMSQYEVTFEEYDQFAVATGRDPPPDDRGWGREKRPVINVSWQDAVAYAAWLTERTRTLNPYRLPSEAEWEYAARGGRDSDYWWGDHIRQDGKVWAVCFGCSDWDFKRSAPVGQFPANPYGLNDTAGNVWEWVEDCYHATYLDAPRDGAAWMDGPDCPIRVIRGGSWNNEPSSLRSVTRGRGDPSDRAGNVGFRLAQDLK